MGVEISGNVNVRSFSSLAAGGDWAPAIQAAVDHVSAENGFVRGGTIFFPPGLYRVGRTVRLGLKPEHYGVRLSGYGAELLGTKELDAGPPDYDERRLALAGKGDKFGSTALPGELDFNGVNVGPAILELWNPEGTEGSSFVVEGLTFDREAPFNGVGVKVPAETVPKNITFRDVKVYRQNVGVHVNHCYQVRFESCIVRGNRTGLWGRNHFNSVSITNSTFRRHLEHGLVIGPNAGQWGSSGINVSGSIFESNGGYGILNAGGVAVRISGNYFEANGNSVGVFSPYWNTTLDTNIFAGFDGGGGHENRHRGEVVSGRALVVIDSSDVEIRNNTYYCGRVDMRRGAPRRDALMVFSLGGRCLFDQCPVPADAAELADGARAGDARGQGFYEYDAGKREFIFRGF